MTLEEIQNIIDDLQNKIDRFEVDPERVEPTYREMLDATYHFRSIGGPFTYMEPSKVLETMDPTAYREGLNDFLDTELRDNPTQFPEYVELQNLLDEALSWKEQAEAEEEGDES